MTIVEEISYSHPNGDRNIFKVSPSKDNSYDLGSLDIPDKKITIEIINDPNTLSYAEKLSATLLKTKIPAIITFSLKNGQVIRGKISELKIIQINECIISLDLFGNEFKRIL